MLKRDNYRKELLTMENYIMRIEERTGKSAKELVGMTDRPDYFDITSFDEIKKIAEGGLCVTKVSDLPTEMQDITDSHASVSFGSFVEYFIEYIKYLAKAGKDVPFTAADLSSMNYSYKDGTIPFSVDTVKMLYGLYTYDSASNKELSDHIHDFEYIEENRDLLANGWATLDELMD